MKFKGTFNSKKKFEVITMVNYRGTSLSNGRPFGIGRRRREEMDTLSCVLQKACQSQLLFLSNALTKLMFGLNDVRISLHCEVYCIAHL